MPPQRHASMLWHKTLDGDWVIRDQPTYEELIRHAEKYGTAQIAETMVQLGYDLEALTSAIERLDIVARVRHEHEQEGKVRKFGKQKKQSAETRAKKLLNWEDPEKVAAREEAEAAAALIEVAA